VSIDSYEQILPAGPVDRVTPVSGDPIARPLDTAQFLGVDVAQTTGVLMLVAHDWFRRFQITQVRQTGTLQNPAHGAVGDPQGRGNPGLRQALAAQFWHFSISNCTIRDAADPTRCKDPKSAGRTADCLAEDSLDASLRRPLPLGGQS
jgi:hypothetical protein